MWLLLALYYQGVWRRVKRAIRPNVILGIMLGLLLMAFLVNSANLGKVAAAFAGFSPLLLPLIFALVFAREAIRIVEWRFLLHSSGIDIRWRHGVLALLGGDSSQLLPGGIYISNYLLHREESADVASSLSATLAMQMLEAFICLVALVIVPVPGWPWLRLVAATVLAGFVAFLLAVSRHGLVEWLERHAPDQFLLHKLIAALERFLESMECLMHPGVISRAICLSLPYLACTIGAFWAVLRSSGLDWVGLPQAIAIYSFVLTIVILVPLPTDLGLSEGSCVTIFLAFGVPAAEGLTAMLIIRFSVLLGSAFLAALAALIFHEELRHLSLGPALAEEQ